MKKITLVISLMFVFTLFPLANNTNAQVPFGGLVTASIFCPCSGNFLLTLGPPFEAQLVYYMGVQSFLHYNLPRPGVWVVGNFSPFGMCLTGTFCTPFGAPIGTILPMVGTSL